MDSCINIFGDCNEFDEYFDVVSLHFDRFILFCCFLSISVARRLSEERDSGLNIGVGFMD